MPKRRRTKAPARVKLMVSDEKRPKVQLKPGVKFHVTSVSLVDATLKRPSRLGARLCGGTSTCIALVDIEE